jgi:hypothetical protein
MGVMFAVKTAVTVSGFNSMAVCVVQSLLENGMLRGSGCLPLFGVLSVSCSNPGTETKFFVGFLSLSS